MKKKELLLLQEEYFDIIEKIKVLRKRERYIKKIFLENPGRENKTVGLGSTYAGKKLKDGTYVRIFDNA